MHTDCPDQWSEILKDGSDYVEEGEEGRRG